MGYSPSQKQKKKCSGQPANTGCWGNYFTLDFSVGLSVVSPLAAWREDGEEIKTGKGETKKDERLGRYSRETGRGRDWAEIGKRKRLKRGSDWKEGEVT